MGRTFIILTLALLTVAPIFGQEGEAGPKNNLESKLETAPIKIDGNVVFEVRGVSSFPAKERAKLVTDRIYEVAADYSLSSQNIKKIDDNRYSSIYVGNKLIIKIVDADAEIEGLEREILADILSAKIKATIDLYRLQRSRAEIVKNIQRAVIATVILIIALLLLLWLSKKLKVKIETRIRSKIDAVDDVSFRLIKSSHLWKVFHTLTRTFRTFFIIFILIFFIDYVLGMFPWTNELSKYILKILGDPIIELGTSFISYIPSLLFLVVIYFITKYLLRLIKLFFNGLEEGVITIKEFDPEWAKSTFKIIRVLIVAFALVIAYPYIPGSDSVAFKGVSVFIGIIFSLGSSSIVSNLIAGYSMIYRGAFKVGDCIEVEDQKGFVVEQKLLVTRLRTFKNEEIILPNTQLLNNKITNYNVKAQDSGIILHTNVGIGYETPWRQVDAMLKLAAKRTEGLLQDPPPYVLQKTLGDFAINYEINAYCKDIPKMMRIYSALHQNILDIFNENNIQIMTPAYEGDPETPKVVPPDQWYTPLAKEE